MISVSAVLVYQTFRGTKGLWELLTFKNMNRKHITTDDLKKYKKILVLTNAHLTDYQPGGDIQVTQGPKFNDVISHLFSHTRWRNFEPALRRMCLKWYEK